MAPGCLPERNTFRIQGSDFQAHSLFAEGSLAAARFLDGKIQPGGYQRQQVAQGAERIDQEVVRDDQYQTVDEGSAEPFPETGS